MPASFPWICNPSHVSVECLLDFRDVKVDFGVPLGAGIICSIHPSLDFDSNSEVNKAEFSKPVSKDIFVKRIVNDKIRHSSSTSGCTI